MPNDKIECSFSLLDSGRKYSGQHRKYLIENAREICYLPAVRERIKMREALGYYGHGRRVLCGRMDIQEVDVVTLPDGSQAMVSNVPSNVTVQFDISKDGLVSHTQEILNTETGKIVAALHASRVGGAASQGLTMSWRRDLPPIGDMFWSRLPAVIPFWRASQRCWEIRKKPLLWLPAGS